MLCPSASISLISGIPYRYDSGFPLWPNVVARPLKPSDSAPYDHYTSRTPHGVIFTTTAHTPIWPPTQQKSSAATQHFIAADWIPHSTVNEVAGHRELWTRNSRRYMETYPPTPTVRRASSFSSRSLACAWVGALMRCCRAASKWRLAIPESRILLLRLLLLNQATSTFMRHATFVLSCPYSFVHRMSRG